MLKLTINTMDNTMYTDEMAAYQAGLAVANAQQAYDEGFAAGVASVDDH